MLLRTSLALFASFLMSLSAGCSDARPALPPMQMAQGPLDVRVVYPGFDALIATPDSNWVMGSIGNGQARVMVNGREGRVFPNGSFLAFLAVPPAGAEHYEVVAWLDADTARLTLPIRRSAEAGFFPTGPLAIDPATLTPQDSSSLRDEEVVSVSVRAPADVTAWVRLPGGIQPRHLGNTSADPTHWAAEVRARDLRRGADLWVARGSDTLRLAVPPIQAPPEGVEAWGWLGGDPHDADSERIIVARTEPNGPFGWYLLPGTRVELTGRIGDNLRIRLDGGTEAWVRTRDVSLPASPRTARAQVLGEASFAPSAEGVDLILPLRERPPFLVEHKGNSLVLTLYGVSAAGGEEISSTDPLVRRVRRTRGAEDRLRFTIELDRAPLGYAAHWQDNAFVLRIRRPPQVERAAPLRGLTIAVDPGHPPLGAVGPTGLHEAEATLEIAQRLQRLLEQRGARVVLTRTTGDSVSLRDRPIIAQRANAHALVSLHLNAFGEGKNPFDKRGTSTFYFFPHAKPLARSIHRELLRHMGLHDQGVSVSNLELTRVTWMPSVLAEGAFITIPEQEAALRTAAFQEAYARGIADGLEAYFRSFDARRWPMLGRLVRGSLSS
jgi:N-acetylmuramoyl-L-alanine amidase